MTSVDLILDTPVSIKWLQTILTKQLAGTKTPFRVEMQSWSSERIAEGMGFLSNIIRVQITWSKSTNVLPSSVVLKIPTIKSITDLFAKMVPDSKGVLPPEFASQVHTVECTFYNLWRDGQAPPCKIPRCYLAQAQITNGHPPILIFQDLSTTSTVQSLLNGLNLQQMLQVAENIANVHAWSLKTHDWMDKFPLPDLKDFESFSDMMVPMIDGMKKEHPDLFPASIMDPLYNCCSMADYVYSFTVYKEFNMPPVLCQGDLWINNILFKKRVNRDGNASAGDELVAIIDWQLAHPGSAAEDFSRCLCTSTTETVRRNHLKTIMQHYYNKLKENLGQNPPFTFDILMKCYNRLMKFGMLGGLGPIMMLPKMNPTIFGGEQEMRRMLIRARCLIEDTLPFLNDK